MTTVRREGVNVTDGAVHVTVAPGSTIPSPTFTGAAGFADGTASAPSIAWTSDQDGSGTGFYRSGADAVSVSCGGSESVRIGSSSTVTLPSNSAALRFGASTDAIIIRAAANSLQFSASVTAAAATSRTQGNKAVASIGNNSATTVATITIPNGAHSASIMFQATGSMGAGGAIGANEASATNCYIVTIARTAGVAVVGAISSAFGAAAANVAGAGSVTSVLTLAAPVGSVGATNTIDVQVTIARSGGSSTNHTCVLTWSLLNANSTGVTIA